MRLSASGAENRWNQEGEYVIYAAQSRSLATLELVVHRASIKPDSIYKVLTIDVDVKRTQIKRVDLSQLPADWQSIRAYDQLQRIGSEWYREKKKLILEIPSAVIPKEKNYLINTRHHLFKTAVRLVESEYYFWDERLLST